MMSRCSVIDLAARRIFVTPSISYTPRALDVGMRR